jgi:hypothetical protein
MAAGPAAPQKPAAIPVNPGAAAPAPRIALANTQRAIAGASFALVLAVAGGFAAAKLVTPAAATSTPPIAPAGSADTGLTSPGAPASGTASPVAPPSATSPSKAALTESDDTERVLASFAYSAAGTLTSRADSGAFEGSLRANAAYINSNAQLVAFAEDSRRLLARRA